MNTRVSVMSIACGLAVLSVLAPFIEERPMPATVRSETSSAAAPTPVIVQGIGPAHGSFSARFQPVLDGVGSVRSLTPVHPGEMPHLASSVPASSTDSVSNDSMPVPSGRKR